MGRPDYEDSAAGGEYDAGHLYAVGDSTGSLTASGARDPGSVSGRLQESDNGTP